jgi:Mg-chelatase subunit ChlD
MATRSKGPAPDVYGADRTPYIDAATVAAVQTTFNRTRLSHQRWEGRQLQGRIDQRFVWRNTAKGDVDIFKERRLPSPTKLDVHLLVDASGSMMGARACRAQDMAATLVDAFKRIPTIRVHVWQHHALNGQTTIVRVFEPGMPADKIRKMTSNSGGGNADGFALEAVGMRAVSQQRPDTKSMVIVISDGLPSVTGVGATADIHEHSKMVADTLRKKGVEVIAVAIAGSDKRHRQMYGNDKCVLFEGDWSHLSRDFAGLFGKALATGRRVM